MLCWPVAGCMCVRESLALLVSKLGAPRRELDLAILQDALAKEAAEEAAEAAAYEAKRHATQQYRRQLAAMMAKQDADQGVEDARIDAINRQSQAKREAEWAARDAARRKLMEEVQQIRQEQVARKQHARCVD